MNLETEFKKIIEHLRKELSLLRTGRATPALVEDIKVDAYGDLLPVKQLGHIMVPESNMITIDPWDKSLLKNIEKAISASDLSINPVNEGALLRLTLPQLTEERRLELKKLVQKKLEEAKVTVRNVREKALKDIRTQESDGQMSEDQMYLDQKDIQRQVDIYNEHILEIGKKKEEEIEKI